MINVKRLTSIAIQGIKAQVPGQVYASRPGICAGVCLTGRRLILRRKHGRVQLEIWENGSQGRQYKKQDFFIPDNLQAAAAEALDNLTS
jgi:hypothetical protein